MFNSSGIQSHKKCLSPSFPFPEREKESIDKSSVLKRAFYYVIPVIAGLGLLIFSGYLCRNDSPHSLVGENLNGTVYFLSEIFFRIARFLNPQPWSSWQIYLAIIPLVLLCLTFIHSRPGIPWLISRLLLTAPFGFLLLDRPLSGYWRYAWWLGALTALLGFIFGLCEYLGIRKKKIKSYTADWSRFKSVLILAVILFAAYGIRVIWVDEVPYYFDADALHDMHYLIRDVFDRNQNPISYFSKPRHFKTSDEAWYMCLGGYAFKWWGIGLLTIRMTTVLYGILTIWLWYLFLAYLFDRPFALTASFLLALFPFHISYSRYGHTFHIPLLLFILGGFCAFKFLYTEKKMYAFLSGFVCGCSYIFHLSGLSVVFIVPAVLLSGWIQRRKGLRFIGIALALLILGGAISSAFFWTNLKRHKGGLQHTMSKGIIPQNSYGSVFPVQSDKITAKFKRNTRKFVQFFIYRGTIGHLLTGGDSYFEEHKYLVVVYSLLYGFGFFGLGYSLFRIRDERFRFFLWMLLFVPVPGMLSIPLTKRMVALSLPFTGIITISFILFFRNLYMYLSRQFKWVVPVLISIILGLYGLNSVQAVLQPDKNHERLFSLRYAKDFGILIDRQVQLITNMTAYYRNAVLLFTEERVRQKGGHRGDYYRITNWPEFFSALTYGLDRFKPVGVFIHKSRPNFPFDPLIFRKMWPEAEFHEEKYYMYIVLDDNLMEKYWGLRSCKDSNADIGAPRGRSGKYNDIRGQLPEKLIDKCNFMNDTIEFQKTLPAYSGGVQALLCPSCLEGWMYFPMETDYVFSIFGNCTIQIEIDEQLLILANGDSDDECFSGSLFLEQGPHKVRITHIGNPAPFQLIWQFDNREEIPVPWSVFYPVDFF